MFAVTVTLYLNAGTEADFMHLLRSNAATSLRKEEGCHQFDIALNPGNATEVFLYELYTDTAAFDAHVQTAHFKEFDGATAQMVAHKEVKLYSEVTQ